MQLLSDLFRQNAISFGSSICLDIYQPDSGLASINSLSYRQFYCSLHNAARILQETYKLKSGDTLGIVADNSLAYLILTYGASLAGIRVLLISTKVLPEHLNYFLQSTACKLLFTSSAYEKLAAQIDIASVAIESAGLDAAANFTTDAASEAYIAADMKPDDCALILHTSGTTKLPRLIYLSHQNILSNQQAVDASVAEFWTSNDSALILLPLFHGYTLLSQFLRNIYIGARTALYVQAESPTAEKLLQALEYTNVSFFCCVPWMLNLLHDQILAEQLRGSSHTLQVLQRLKFIITGGALLERSTGDFFTENKVRLVTFFGLTEAAGFVMHSSFTNEHWDLLHPLPLDGLHFIPDTVTPDEYELVLSGTQLASQTLAASMLQIISEQGHDFSTSDMFKLTPDGWQYLGRNDQVYNGPQGEKINPLHFETALEKLPSVEKVFVNGEGSYFNAALVAIKPELIGNTEAIEKLHSYINEVINPQLEPAARVYANDVFILGSDEAIPLTPKGNVNRQTASAMLKLKLQKREAQLPLETAGSIKELVKQQIRAYLKISSASDISETSGLFELGFDSLMVLSLRNSLQVQLKLDIPLELMLNFPRVDTLVAALNHLSQTRKTANTGAKQQTEPTPGNQQWRNIPLEQVIFHTAHYIFPFPTYNVSMSLLAPGYVSDADIVLGLKYLETRHEILRSVYRPDGTFKIAAHSFTEQALLGISAIEGSHNIYENPQVQSLIGGYLNCSFDLTTGPLYRYAIVNITNTNAITRTLIYVGLNHIASDFKGFSGILNELMDFLVADSMPENPASDNYAALVPTAGTQDLQIYQECWRQILTVMPELVEGLDFRAGHKQLFKFNDIDLNDVAGILRKHNISLYNGIYAIYIIALSRHLPDQALENFLSATAVTSRITAETENLTGCFIHSPVLRFRLNAAHSMLQMMSEVQHTTANTFSKILNNPVSYMLELAADPANLVPFINRNVFLYRSPEEIMKPLPGWDYYRNELFFDHCDVGMYFDFCANTNDQCMEGYILMNLHYCKPEIIQPMLADIRELLLHITNTNDLAFLPNLLLPTEVKY